MSVLYFSQQETNDGIIFSTLDVEKSLPKRRGLHLRGDKTARVSAAASDESVAGDSGVYEASVKQ